MLTLGRFDPLWGKANALSTPPGKYDRKVETQRNRRKAAQAVDHVVQFDSNRKILPGLDMLVLMPLPKGRGSWILSGGQAQVLHGRRQLVV